MSMPSVFSGDATSLCWSSHILPSLVAHIFAATLVCGIPCGVVQISGSERLERLPDTGSIDSAPKIQFLTSDHVSAMFQTKTGGEKLLPGLMLQRASRRSNSFMYVQCEMGPSVVRPIAASCQSKRLSACQ